MSKIIQINGYDFQGPYELSTTSFNNVAGVYFISDDNGNNIDVGETDALATRLSNHDRKDCWERNSVGNIYVWFHAEKNENIRLEIENIIRGSRKFFCGLI